MEEFKIEHFNRENPTKKFPEFRILKSIQANEIYKNISDKIGELLPKDQLVKKIDAAGIFIEGINADNEEFILKEVFDNSDIQPQEKVYINWYQFDNIDEIKFVDLNRFFSDIWYPSSDDIDIFDETFSWILSISHEGNIKVVKI